jgi:hypothetical protein
MIEFVTTNWVALLSLIIALIGGVPGIVSLVEQFHKRPTFLFTLVHTIIGTWINPEWPKPGVVILITGTIANEGDRSLVPSQFNLRAKTEQGWILFEKQLIRENEEFPGVDQVFRIEDAEKHDLQRFKGSITNGNPAYGHLKFITNKASEGAFTRDSIIAFEIRCDDIFGKEYRCKVNVKGEGGSGKTFPKHGLTVLSEKVATRQ